MDAQESKAEAVDGRRLRTIRNRRKIIDALIEATKSGDFSPRAEELADAAGVGLRSLFRHFKDMESLYREVGEEFTSKMEPHITTPLEGDTWRELLDALMVRKSELMQECMHMFLFGRMHRHESRYIRIEQDKVRLQERKALARVLPAEVVRDKDLFEALDLAISMDSWARLRKEQNLSVHRSLAVTRRIVDALLSGIE